MIVFAVIYLLAWGIVIGALAMPPHKFAGRFAGWVFVILGLSGLALAVNAL